MTSVDCLAQVPEALNKLPNLQSLSLTGLYNHPLLSLDTLCRGCTALGPRLTRLHIQVDMKHIPELVAVGPWAVALESLELGLEGNGSTEYNIDGIVPTLIEPTRASLKRLKIHIKVPVMFHYSCVRPFRSSPTPARTLAVGTLFEALAALTFPKLRDLSVASPFNGALSQNEEASLVRFIRAHALEHLEVTPGPVEAHSGQLGTSYRYSGNFARFFATAASLSYHGSHLRSIHVAVPEDCSHEAVLDFLAQVRGPLASLVLEGRGLENNEFEQLTCALRSVSQTMRALHLSLARLAPYVLESLSRALSSLEELTIDANLISGLKSGPRKDIAVRQ
jgi:hypothetical protein